ncbi:MAG: Asp23/Gls24 family envelope stress response protein [Oscillospiraceae bacterium]|nr:Asp23/Gls24 family envelope stress response protein [Oscillospiraceae bacterium]
MTIQNEKGAIEITNEVFTMISGSAATNCFGVKGMAHRNVKDGIVGLLKRENIAKGVKVAFEEDEVVIDLHIAVEHGVNITAVSNSIMTEVKYIVEQMTRVKVRRVNVYVDSIMVG